MRLLDEARWREIEPQLDRALELEGEARAAFLAELRHEEPEAARLLDELLRVHERAMASRFLEELPDPEEQPSLAGQILGPYTLVALLGSGGMGAVWRARRSDGRFAGDVAVKLLHPSLLDGQGEARFRREGTILSRLTHPGIARLYDAGVSPGGQPYLVLELVEGTPLDRSCDARRLDVRARLELFLQVIDAVAHAHANLVVHRDLKPSNILVDREGRVKLLDFGVATLVDEASGAAVAWTRTGRGALTPGYAAPEQIAGGPTTVATDVYALGVVLYELLTGRHPLPRDASTPAGAARALAAGEPATMSERVARSRAADVDDRDVLAARGTTRDRLARELAGDLDTIVAQALKADPAERYPTAAALADDLRRYLQDQPVRARPDSAAYRLRKFVARHRLETAAASIAALALVGGTLIALAQARASRRERDDALEHLRRAEVTNDLSSFMLSAAAPATGRATAKADLLASAEEMVHRRFAADPALRVHLLLALGERYDENYQVEARKRAAERAYELSRPLPEPPLRALAGCLLAIVRSDEGDADGARRLLEEAFAELQDESRTAGEEARCRVAEARVAFGRDDVEGATHAAERALALERARRGPPGRELEALNALAMAYRGAKRFVEADRAYLELMRAFDEQGRARTQSAAIVASSWATVLDGAGQKLRAVELYESAIALATEVYPDQGPQPAVLASFARALAAVGRLEEALAVTDQSVARARVAEESWPLPYALGTAAMVAIEAGRVELSEAPLAEFERLVREVPSIAENNRLALDRYRARADLARGDAHRAVALGQELLRRHESTSPGRENLAILQLLASSLNASGDFVAAKTFAERCLGVVRARLGGFSRSHDLGLAQLEIGIAEAGLGERDAARRSLDSAIEDLRATVGEAGPDYRRALAARDLLDG